MLRRGRAREIRKAYLDVTFNRHEPCLAKLTGKVSLMSSFERLSNIILPVATVLKNFHSLTYALLYRETTHTQTQTLKFEGEERSEFTILLDV